MNAFVIVAALCAAVTAVPVERSAVMVGDNVSYGKSVMQSSVERWATCPPSKLTDGNFRSDITDDSCACTLTKKEENPWVRINLGEPIEITYVTVATRWRQPSYANRDSNLEVRIGNDPDISKNALCKYMPGQAKQASGRVDCITPLVGQYVSVQRIRSGYVDNMHICEMRAYRLIPEPTPLPPRQNCFMEKDLGTGSGSEERYYFNEPKCECQSMLYKGEGGNGNNFVNLQDCQNLCTEWEPPGRCFADKDEGDGASRHPRFYYSPELNLCKKLAYTGSGGTGNNFPSKLECRNECKRC